MFGPETAAGSGFGYSLLRGHRNPLDHGVVDTLVVAIFFPNTFYYLVPGLGEVRELRSKTDDMQQVTRYR